MSKMGQYFLEQQEAYYDGSAASSVRQQAKPLDFAGLCQTIHRRYCLKAKVQMSKQGLRFNDPEHAWLYAETKNDMQQHLANGDHATARALQDDLDAIWRDDRRKGGA